MTREEFKHAYQYARKIGSWHFHPNDPVRIVLLARLWGVDPLEYRASCARHLQGRLKPYGTALARYRIAKQHAKGTCRPAHYRVEGSGFFQLVDREVEIKSWIYWGRCETELDEMAGGLWVFGGEE